MLILLIGFVAPGPGAGFEFGAWLMTGRVGDPVFDLARIRRRSEVDVQVSFLIDDERMHRVVAGERQARENDLGFLVRRDGSRGQRIADDLVVLFGIEPAVIEGDASAARRALRDTIAKALDHIRMAVAFAILQRHQKTAGRRLVVAIIAAAPSVDVEHTVRRKHHVTGVPEIVGENGCAEASGKRDASVIAGAGVRSRTN